MKGNENLQCLGKPAEPQCQFFVQRKKRLCRMTVKPGKNFCGEHEPAPLDAGEQDLRVPCPLDPKHTCYASKLEKHVQICNSRRGVLPEYYEHNVNAPALTGPARARLPLSKVPLDDLNRVIQKVNQLYESVVEQEIISIPEQSIHPIVREEFEATDRTEKSRRHLRQASALLRLCEDQGLVEDGTCYVELGAGKGHLSYFAWLAWCTRQPASRALLLDRAALRHKRDNKLRGSNVPVDTDHTTLAPVDLIRPTLARVDVSDSLFPPMDTAHPTLPPVDLTQRTLPPVDVPHPTLSPCAAAPPVRLRADLAHVALQRVPCVAQCARAVGLAKHLCGVATDYALRCMTAEGVCHKTHGIVLATCCHHRCERDAYIGYEHLLELGVIAEEFDVLLGIVSWATCGDGRSRQRRAATPVHQQTPLDGAATPVHQQAPLEGAAGDDGRPAQAEREAVGRRAKALVDWCRVLALRRRGLSARLTRFVPARVSPENTAIVAHR